MPSLAIFQLYYEDYYSQVKQNSVVVVILISDPQKKEMNPTLLFSIQFRYNLDSIFRMRKITFIHFPSGVCLSVDRQKLSLISEKRCYEFFWFCPLSAENARKITRICSPINEKVKSQKNKSTPCFEKHAIGPRL